MIPCPENKKPLAWLAAGHCEAAEARRLRGHLSLCRGCRSYFEEMAGLVANLSAAERSASLEPSESFHAELAGRVRSASTRPVRASLASLLAHSRAGWRLLFPALGAAAAVIAIFFHFPSPPVSRPIVAAPRDLRPPTASDLDPTLVNYLKAADRSLDDLDALLARQAAAGGGSSGPLYTASAATLVP